MANFCQKYKNQTIHQHKSFYNIEDVIYKASIAYIEMIKKQYKSMDFQELKVLSADKDNQAAVAYT
jgi:hypothetical protein